MGTAPGHLPAPNQPGLTSPAARSALCSVWALAVCHECPQPLLHSLSLPWPEALNRELVLAFQTLRAAGLPPCQSHHKPLAAVSATISLALLEEGLRVLGAPAEQQGRVWTPLP